MHTCISSHGLKRSWRSCPRRVNASNKNTPSMHHPRRRNVTTLTVGLKKRSHTQKSHPKVVNPRDIAGECNQPTKQALCNNIIQKAKAGRSEVKETTGVTRFLYLRGVREWHLDQARWARSRTLRGTLGRRRSGREVMRGTASRCRATGDSRNMAASWDIARPGFSTATSNAVSHTQSQILNSHSPNSEQLQLASNQPVTSVSHRWVNTVNS